MGITESVRFGVNSNASYMLQSSTPFALASDNKGDYFNWSVTPGTYTITATPYSLNFGRGKPGKTTTITVKIINSKELPPSITGSKREQPESTLEKGFFLKIYPNPVEKSGFVEFEVPHTASISVTLLDATGNTVQQIFTGRADNGVLHRKAIQTSGLPPGVYFCRLVTAEGIMLVSKLVKQ